jgi:L-amino acid N-acyltransferase YncA
MVDIRDGPLADIAAIAAISRSAVLTGAARFETGPPDAVSSG